MKVYIVKAPQGEYEDYCEPIVKVFANKGKAEEYIKIENAKLPLEQAAKCAECLWARENDEKPKCFNPNKYKTCKNYFKYRGIYPLFMEEYELDITQSLKQQVREEVVEEIIAQLSKIEDTLINCGNGKEDALACFLKILRNVKGESNDN